MTLDFGDVPTWLATLGAFAAVLFASRAYGMEKRRDAVAADLRLQEQPSRLAIWPESDYLSDELGFIDLFVVRNASELPVYDLVVVSFRYTVEEPTRKPA